MEEDLERIRNWLREELFTATQIATTPADFDRLKEVLNLLQDISYLLEIDLENLTRGDTVNL